MAESVKRTGIFETQHSLCNTIQCILAQVKIGVTSGFKTIKVSEAGFGFEISGILGSFAQYETSIRLCADGTEL